MNEVMNKPILSEAKKKRFPVLACIIIAVLTAFALEWKLLLSDLPMESFIGQFTPLLTGASLAEIIVISVVLAGLYIHAWTRLKPSFQVSTLVLSIVFTLNTLIGRSFNAYDSLYGLIGNRLQIALLLPLSACMLFFFYTVNRELIFWINRSFVQKNNAPSYGKASNFLFGRSILIPFCIILLGWLPYLIAFYPGSMEWDYFVQLGTYTGYYARSNSHPFFSTLLIGNRMELGCQFGSYNLGAFLYILLQSIVLAFSFAYAARTAYRWKCPKLICFGMLGYFAFLPLWGFVAQFGIKDILYTAVLSIFATLAWVYVLEKNAKKTNIFHLVALFLSGLLSCLLRLNGIVIILPTLLGLLVVPSSNRSKLKVLVITILLMIGLFAWNNLVLPAMQVQKGSVREILSIPFQQTARYLRDHKEDVNEEEAEAIGNVLDYENIGDYYMSMRSDLVKGTFNENSNEDDLFRYFRAWLSMLKKHPLTYTEAFFSNTYTYYAPEGILPYLPLCEFNVEIEKSPILYYGDVSLEQIPEMMPMRECLIAIYSWMKETPIVSWLLSQGFYTFLGLGLVNLLWIYRRRSAMIGFLPSLFVFICCVLSPVNGMLRYYLPIIAFMPLSVAATLKSISSSGFSTIPEKDDDQL